MDNEKLDGIIRKIKGLIALAENNANDEEAQSAFVLAQKLMMRYNIELEEIRQSKETDLTTGQATVYKTVYWYEKILARIISQNFRVQFYYSNRKTNGESKRKSSIKFYGLEQDVKIAKELFILANEALNHYTKEYIKLYYYENDELKRVREFTQELKNSYMRGFLDGLSDKLSEQRNSLQQEFGLVVLMPQVVIDGYAELSKDFEKGTRVNIPSIEEMYAYMKGQQDGKKIDYSKSTIDNI